MSTTAGLRATVSVDIGGTELLFETGKLAKHADGAGYSLAGRGRTSQTSPGRGA